MKITHRSKVHGFILEAALLAGLGFVTHAAAQQEASYFIDLSSRTAINLGSLGGSRTIARALNDSGQVVGESYTAGGELRAFITGPNGVGMRDLGTLGGNNYSRAYGINDAGQVVGESYTDGGEPHAFITGPDGVGMRDLGTLGGDNFSRAYDINEAGQVVGKSYMLPGGGSPCFHHRPQRSGPERPWHFRQ